jgi:hypothetical protein
MKRYGNLWQDVIGFEALRPSEGKREGGTSAKSVSSRAAVPGPHTR